MVQLNISLYQNKLIDLFKRLNKNKRLNKDHVFFIFNFKRIERLLLKKNC